MVLLCLPTLVHVYLITVISFTHKMLDTQPDHFPGTSWNMTLLMALQMCTGEHFK